MAISNQSSESERERPLARYGARGGARVAPSVCGAARGFTLIEMLVVVTVLVTLMTMVFRLSSVGGSSWRRNTTIARIQKLENCLSGYYAAFGSYPPVKVQGSRSIYYRTDVHGIQSDERNEMPVSSIWNQVDAACKSQPVACQFPFPDDYREVIEAVAETMRELSQEKNADFYNLWSSDGGKTEDSDRMAKYAAKFDDGGGGTGRFSSSDSDWRNVQVFRFGLMSYLLPRYLVMMGAADAFFNGNFKQWEANNSLPCDPLTGDRFSSWSELKNYVKQYEQSGRASDLAKVVNIPSQAICARWMPNLESSCQCNRDFTFFGVNIKDSDQGILNVQNRDIEIFSPQVGSNSTSDQYILDSITMQDGWGRDIYYYSPAPYQKYVVWSAGENGRTFPPWIPRKTLNSIDADTVANWTHDDITGMSH